MTRLQRRVLRALPASHVRLCERLNQSNERIGYALGVLIRAGKVRPAADGWGWERVFRSTMPRRWTATEVRHLIEMLPEARNYAQIGERIGRRPDAVRQRIAAARKKAITPSALAP